MAAKYISCSAKRRPIQFLGPILNGKTAFLGMESPRCPSKDRIHRSGGIGESSQSGAHVTERSSEISEPAM
ncbi:hypothetical protein Bpfe_009854 [Biomphalaria pfeifferi]|uniref:Uncharacterized protein n=1 Tax=Biomphalaria pfeifferi TaxID=112525 RepID=A0AAD8FEP1_BIOPF|nr:hypothetical protein Bpfe_009854 [Biomphalaria pfeifferi]